MQRERTSEIFVAPLHIRKPLGDISSEDSTFESFSSKYEPPRPRFHNYLRAAYPFSPAAAPSASTVTLPLNAGDIILIHSVHTNGWADGTLLETGERGWLPTNYCEPYDYTAMRPLLRALTDFWDIMRCGTESNVGAFQSKDYMRGLVAGVRYLLERCDCLTRETPNVRQFDGIRRARKGLLSDLSLLVKAGKHVQVMIPSLSSATQSELDQCLDELLLHAFQIVTRAVKFFDTWGEEAAVVPSPGGLTQAIQELSAQSDGHFSPGPSSNRHTGSTARYSTFSTAANFSPQQSTHALSTTNTSYQAQSLPIENKRISISHRMSYFANPTSPSTTDLASDRLNQCYDAFLGVLASFLGSHMQSRSSSELLLTTQQAVKSCRELLWVVETVIDQDLAAAEALTESKDGMYDAITELVSAAKQVFRPSNSGDEDVVYLPEEGRRLVQAATTCVSGAGRCVARTRAVLEEGGDFEMNEPEDSGNKSSGDNTPARGSLPQHIATSGLQITGIVSSSTMSNAPKSTSLSPRNHIPKARPLLRGASASTTSTSIPPKPADRSMPNNDSDTTLHSPILDRPVSSEYAIPVGHLRHKSLARNVVLSTGSDSTLESSNGMTDASDLSIVSTRATSYDPPGSIKFSSQESLAHFPALDEEAVEAVILEKTFSHELMSNNEGQIVGGTLNALVERLTSADSTPDALFVTTTYLTFRLFARPQEFVDALTYRFRYIGESPHLAGPVRLRVYNAFKGWLESHWRHDCDDATLPSIIAFAREDLQSVLQTASKRLLELVDIVGSTHAPAVPRVVSAIGKTSTSSSPYVNPESPLPPPILSKSQLTALRTWKMGGAGVTILDFDAMELARQITLKTSLIFCSILPEELLATEWTKQSSSLAVNVRAMSTLSTDLSNLVSDSILQLEEPKKRAATIKQWIKVATKCLDLNNYDTVWAIVCSLDSTNIKRMRKTWEIVPQKSKNLFDELRKVCDVSKNYNALRRRLEAEIPPCLPFLGVYLTDLTMIDVGNAAKRQLKLEGTSMPVINLDKHMKTATVISDLQRFQIPYRFIEVSELQTWMQDQLIRVRSAGEKNYQNQYRRSLILEPREPAKQSPNPAGSTKDRFDLTGWMHLGKDKMLSVNPA